MHSVIGRHITVSHPFNWHARSLPTQKRLLNTVDEFHSIEHDEARRKVTTFITEWGRYRCCCLPQGYLAATGAFTRIFEGIIKDVPNKVKCIGDTLLYDHAIETVFNHTWDYLNYVVTGGLYLI